MTPKKFGAYTIQREIARGGQGAVMEATHTETGRRVALKMLLTPNARTLKRFQQEGKVLLRLEHPNLIGVSDLGERNGLPFLAMDFVEGEDLRAIVEGREQLPPCEWSAEVMARIAEALQYCHDQGIVHRDVKPANVLIERNTYRPVLVDFGLIQRDAESFHLTSLDDASRFSVSGELKGTPAFMPPEQARPKGKYGEVGPASDVYALGGTLYYLLTGRPPFRSDSLPGLLYKVLNEAPVDPARVRPDAPPHLARLCLLCMAKAPADRPESAAAVARALMGGPGDLPPGPRRALRWRPAGVVLLLGLVGAGGWLASRPEPTPRDPPAHQTPDRIPTKTEPVPKEPPPAEDEPARLRPLGTPNQRAEYTRISLEGAKRYTAGDYAAAVKLFSRAIAIDPKLEHGYLNRGRANAALGKHALALQDIDEAIAKSPELDDVFFFRAASLAALGRHAEAIAAFSRALRRKPLADDLLYYRGVSRQKNGDHAGAVTDFSEVLGQEGSQYRRQARIKRGWSRYRMKQYRQAIADYDLTLEVEPKRAWTFYNRGLARYALNEMKQALADYSRAIELDPRHHRALRARGWLHFIEGRHAEAKRDYGRAVTLAPNNASLRISRGIALRGIGDLSGSTADFAWVAEQGRSLRRKGYAHRALNRLLQRDFTGGLADCASALKLQAKFAMPHKIRGDIYRTQGDLPAALAAYATALKISPEYVGAQAGRGLVRIRQGQQAAGREDLEQALPRFKSWDWMRPLVARKLAELKQQRTGD